MTRDALRSALGGSNALSRWSLIVFLPITFLSGALWGLRNGLAPWPWLLVVAMLQALLVPVFWLCRVLLVRASANGPRPVLGVSMFAFLGGLRALLIVPAGDAMGLTLPSGSAIYFVPNGVGIGVAILGIVAVVVDGGRTHRTAMENLAALDAEFERTRVFDEAELAGIEAQSIDRITLMLEAELHRLQPIVEDRPDQVPALLRALASDVVRPLSHDLADSEPWVPQAESTDVVLPRWERMKAVVGDMRPANPLIPFLLIELIALPTAISERVGGVAFAAFVMLLGGGVMFGLSWLLARAWPSGRTTAVRALVLVFSYVVIGTVAAWVMLTTTRVVVGVENPIWITPFYLTAISVGLSVRVAVSGQQRAAEDRMAVAVARNAQLNAHVRERSYQAQRRIAQLLHGSVQAELIASAMLLAAGTGTSDIGARTIEEMNRLSEVMSQRVVDVDVVAAPARERILDLVSLWSGVLDLEMDVAEEVWDALDADTSARTRIEQVLAEGLTNAVRHGAPGGVGVVIGMGQRVVVVTISSTGSIVTASAPGLGSRFLTESTTGWTLTGADGQVHLNAEVPLLRAAVTGKAPEQISEPGTLD